MLEDVDGVLQDLYNVRELPGIAHIPFQVFYPMSDTALDHRA
jgi:hypothetical protein